MALGRFCVKCGWLESTHILGDSGVREEDRPYLDKGLPGIPLTFRECRKYKPSPVENAEVKLLNAQAKQAVRVQALAVR